MQVILSCTTFCVAMLACVAIFPLQPNQTPDFCLSAALTTTSSPPARAVAFLSGIATLFETMTSCPNSDPLRDTSVTIELCPAVRETLPAQPVDATLCPRRKDGVYSVISEESRLSVSSKAHLNKAVRRLNERPSKALGIETPAERFNASVASTG